MEVFKEEQDKTRKKHEILLANIKRDLPELKKLLGEVVDHWSYEDSIYRFYHQSFKVYYIQEITNKIVEALRKLKPDEKDYDPFCEYFNEIIMEGTLRNKEWQADHNLIWTTTTRPFLEAFFHAKYFLEMVVKYGEELKEAPQMLPSGYAAVLCLYKLR